MTYGRRYVVWWLLPVFLSILPIAYEMYPPAWAPTVDRQVTLISSILLFNLGCFVSFLQTLLSSQSEHERSWKIALQTFGEGIERLKGADTFEFVGNASQAAAHLVRRLDAAKSVKDVFVIFSLTDEEARGFYSGEDISKLKCAIENFVRAGGKWTEMLSYETRLIPGDLVAFAESMAKHPSNRFIAKVVEPTWPVMNFTLIEYREGGLATEVLFGWGHHKHDPEGQVFSSRDRRVVQMFTSYWDLLKDNSSPLSAISDGQINARSIAGTWFDVAVQEGNTIRDVAIIDIKPGRAGIEVRGTAYDRVHSGGTKCGPVAARFESVASNFDLENKTLWCTYTRTRKKDEAKGPDPILGSTRYVFETNGKFIGDFADEITKNRVKLFGEKITAEELTHIQSGESDRVDLILQRKLEAFLRKNKEFSWDGARW